MLRGGILLAAAIVLLAFGAGCGKKKEPPKVGDQLPFVPGNPWTAYAKDERAAELKYKGNRVEVGGTVMAVKKAPDDPSESQIVLTMSQKVRDMTAKDLSADVILIQVPTTEEVKQLK